MYTQYITQANVSELVEKTYIQTPNEPCIFLSREDKYKVLRDCQWH